MGLSDVEKVKLILPVHYRCEAIGNGVHCTSLTGIDEQQQKLWEYVMSSIRHIFGDRFQEIHHETCYNHKRFIIFLKNENIS